MKRRMIFGASLVAIVMIGLAEMRAADIPDTPAGRLLKSSIQIINSGDMNAIRSFIADSVTSSCKQLFGEEDLFQVFYGFYEKYQELEFHHVVESSDVIITAVHRCRRTGSGYLYGIVVTEDKPHKMRGLTILPLADVDDFVKKLAYADVFSGQVLLARNGKILLEGGYGWADREKGSKAGTDTKFNLASMAKMFTAVATAQLAEQKKITLDDPVSKYLGEDWLPEKIGKKVLIKHLLSHTSGLPGGDENLRFLEEAESRDLQAVDDYRELVGSLSLESKPGSKHSYSNLGFNILGAILEKVTGEDFLGIIRKQVLEPAGMNHTLFQEMDDPMPDFAIGYKKIEEGGSFRWEPHVFRILLSGSPAGGGYSTAGDLFRFQQALLDGTLIQRETAELFYSPKPELKSPNYGYGFSSRNLYGKHMIGHSGGYIGINNNMLVDLDDDVVLIILSNVDLISGNAVSDIQFFVWSLLGIARKIG